MLLSLYLKTNLDNFQKYTDITTKNQPFIEDA
jgi:hypothetical protein